MRGYADTDSFAYFNDYEQVLSGNTLVATDNWWQGIYDTETSNGPCSARSPSTSLRTSRSRPAAAGSSTKDIYRLRQQSPPGSTGYNFQDGTVDTDDNGSS